MAPRSPRTTLTPQDWIDAALRAMAVAGPDGIAVDRLAKELGATRGSFYWHFPDRADLLRAALEHWEQHGTEDVIAHLLELPDPRARLTALLEHAVTATADPLEVALVAAHHPLVAPVLRRVVARRLDVLQRFFEDLGLGPGEARERAWTAYTSYVGHHQLLRGDLAEPPPDLGRMLALLLAPPRA